VPLTPTVHSLLSTVVQQLLHHERTYWQTRAHALVQSINFRSTAREKHERLLKVTRGSKLRSPSLSTCFLVSMSFPTLALRRIVAKSPVLARRTMGSFGPGPWASGQPIYGHASHTRSALIPMVIEQTVSSFSASFNLLRFSDPNLHYSLNRAGASAATISSLVFSASALSCSMAASTTTKLPSSSHNYYSSKRRKALSPFICISTRREAS